jgi:hypothetical protein
MYTSRQNPKILHAPPPHPQRPVAAFTKAGKMPDPKSSLKPSKTVVYMVTFCALFAALFLILVVLPYPSFDEKSNPRAHLLVEHLSMALLIAAVLTLTYEALLDRHREQSLQQSLNHALREFYREVELKNAQNAIIADPRQIMALLYQVVIQMDRIPTLYDPPREHHKECNFTNNLEYLNALSTIHRKEVTEELRDWIAHPKSPVNIKFLASDFIGKYEIRELQDTLLQAANSKLIQWAGITDPNEKSWVLNYLWAYSRCEAPRYKTLGKLLLHQDLPTQKPDNFIDEWILFVPLQMPDLEFLPILRDYVNSGERALQNFTHVQKALLALQTKGIEDAAKILKTLEQRANRVSSQGKAASS